MEKILELKKNRNPNLFNRHQANEKE